jgi:hypothetical protein
VDKHRTGGYRSCCRTAMSFARALPGLILLAASVSLQWICGRAPALVEGVFARRLYPASGGRLGCLSGALPFSLAECAVVAVAVWLAVFTVRLARRKDRRPALARAGARLLLAGGGLYLGFLLLWGLNYQREPFAASAGLLVRPSSFDELTTACGAFVDAANAARDGLPEDAAGVMHLADGIRPTLARTEAGFQAAAERYPFLDGCGAPPKPIFASVAFSWLGITGIYSPFTGEPNVNVNVPDPDLPFCASHEVAHQRGFAREDEANYVGYLACRLHPDPAFRYSGLLSASMFTMNALAPLDHAAWERLDARRSGGVRRDIGCLVAWAEAYKGPVERVSRRVNDAYLRSQGQDQGVRSYGRVVDLLLAERR